MSLTTHVAVLALLILDLTIGGPFIDHLVGRWALLSFEFLLILGYVLLVLQWQPWRRPMDGGGDEGQQRPP